MSLRERLQRWADGSWGVGGSRGGAGTDLGGALRTPADVEEMAEDAGAESDRPEQERERQEEFGSEL